MEAAPSFAELWLGILRSIPGLVWDSAATFEAWIMAGAFFLLLANQRLAKVGRKLLHWDGISRWWALAPVGALVLWSVLGAIHSQFVAQHRAFSAEIKRLNQERLASATPMDLYVPLHREIRDRMVDRLKAVRALGLSLSVVVDCAIGSDSRDKVCRQLSEILVLAGLSPPPPDALVFSIHIPNRAAPLLHISAPIVLRMNGGDQTTTIHVLRFSQELDLMLRTAPLMQSDTTLAKHTLKLEINGEPRFLGDGTVTFIR